MSLQINIDAETTRNIIAALTLLVSAGAFVVAKLADRRSQIAARTKTFLALRSRFISVHEKLPPNYDDPSWAPQGETEKKAAARYWHHAFDEWYITTQLDKKVLGNLWPDFYREAALSGLAHNGLRLHLWAEIKHGSELSEHWKQYSFELERLWAESHPRDQGKCGGLNCNHPPSTKLIMAAAA